MTPRQIIKCPACGLNQFMTADGDCRKCRIPLDEDLDAPAPTKTHRVDLGRVFCTNIVNARESRGWTQRKLASKMGVTQQAVSSLETNGCDPQMRTIQQFADAFGVPAYVLLIPSPKPQQEVK